MPEEFIGELIYQWKVPEDYKKYKKHEDIAQEYRVYKDDKADCGIIIYAKYREEWVCNPFSCRALVYHLLKILHLKQQLIEVLENAEVYITETFSERQDNGIDPKLLKMIVELKKEIKKAWGKS